MPLPDKQATAGTMFAQQSVPCQSAKPLQRTTPFAILSGNMPAAQSMPIQPKGSTTACAARSRVCFITSALATPTSISMRLAFDGLSEWLRAMHFVAREEDAKSSSHCG